METSKSGDNSQHRELERLSFSGAFAERASNGEFEPPNKWITLNQTYLLPAIWCHLGHASPRKHLSVRQRVLKQTNRKLIALPEFHGVPLCAEHPGRFRPGSASSPRAVGLQVSSKVFPSSDPTRPEHPHCHRKATVQGAKCWYFSSKHAAKGGEALGICKSNGQIPRRWISLYILYIHVYTVDMNCVCIYIHMYMPFISAKCCEILAQNTEKVFQTRTRRSSCPHFDTNKSCLKRTEVDSNSLNSVELSEQALWNGILAL